MSGAPALAVRSALVMAVQLPGTHATAWHFFHDSARLLIGDASPGAAGSLQLYGEHPEFQFGPLSIAIAVPFSLLGHSAGSWMAMLLASAAGLRQPLGDPGGGRDLRHHLERRRGSHRTHR